MSRKCLRCKQMLSLNKFLGELTTCIVCSEKRNKGRKCQVCGKNASFGMEIDSILRWCKKDAPLDAVDLVHKTCSSVGCLIRPSYGLPTDLVPTTCVKHKLPESIDLVSKKCNTPNCSIQPVYGYESDKIRIKCKKHKEDGMIDLVSRKCEMCSKNPIYGFASDNIIRWCADHKPNNAVDLKHLICSECNTRASYGIIGSIPSKCVKHKEVGMYANPRKRCMIKSCKELAIYGCSRNQIHCETHKTANDMLLAEYPCKQCGNLDILNENGVCITTCGFLPQFEVYKKHQKRDEKRIFHLLTEEFGEPTSYDSIVKNDCGYRERPDIVYDIPESKIRIIIEIDENGDNHGSDCSNLSKEQNELNRMINIFSSFGEETHTLFIRYNPNKYYVNNIKQTITKTDRENILVKWIKKFIDTSSDVFNHSNLAVLYLFYNEYNTNTIHLKCVDILKAKIYCCGTCSNMLEDKSNYNNIPRAFLYYDKNEYTQHQLTH